MVWPVIARTLAAAASSVWKASKNPAVRKKATEAAKKAEAEFSRFAVRSKQVCKQAWQRIRGRSINFPDKALQKKFKHAIERHIQSDATQVVEGTYHGAPVRHFLDPKTGLNVIKDVSGNFLSGWKLSPAQLKHVLTKGALGGG